MIMKNYLEVISEYYPGTSCYTSGDPNDYASIAWDGAPIPQAELDVHRLGDYKLDKINEFSLIARAEIEGGFESSALGSPYWYKSEVEDQLNLIGAVSSHADLIFPCRVGSIDADKQYLLHTASQLQAVLADGTTIKLAAMQKLNTKKADILAAVDQAAVDLITWV